MNILNYVFRNKDLPGWIVYLNYASLSGIIVWPLVLFGSIFLFDHPQNLYSTFLTVILIDSYPLPLILLTYLSFRVFHFNRLISATPPLIVLIGYIYTTVQFVIPGLGQPLEEHHIKRFLKMSGWAEAEIESRRKHSFSNCYIS